MQLGCLNSSFAKKCFSLVDDSQLNTVGELIRSTNGFFSKHYLFLPPLKAIKIESAMQKRSKETDIERGKAKEKNNYVVQIIILPVLRHYVCI